MNITEDNVDPSVKPKTGNTPTARPFNPLEWSLVDKCLIIGCFWLMAATVVVIIFSNYIKHPDQVPFLNLEAIEAGLPMGYFMICFWTLQLIIGFWLRKHDPDNRLFAYITVFIWWTEEAIAAISMGPMTSPTSMTLLGMSFICFLLFPISISLVGLLWGYFLVAATTTASHFGYMQYAPFIAAPVVQDGKLIEWWLMILGPVYLFLVFIFLAVFLQIISRWRDRENKVAEMSVLLKKMFGRYLSTEVMNSILAKPSSLELGGEKRKVTIMMTDLRGFTAISERLSPEQVVSMLNAYFEIMVDVVLKYHGTINEFIGDALVVLFGAPQDMPDRAQRAVACSIEMQNAMTGVNVDNRKQGLPSLEMGIGLNEAEVIVGNIGSSKRSKYTVIGSGVNMASRIESYTVGGQILISESIYNKMPELLKIESRRQVLPKGAETPIRIFEVSGIAGQYNLHLTYEEKDMSPIPEGVPVLCSVLEDKHVGAKEIAGEIVRLSETRAEIKLRTPLAPLTNLKITLDDVDESLLIRDFYAKIVNNYDEVGSSHILRFTAVPPEVDAFFMALLKYSTVK